MSDLPPSDKKAKSAAASLAYYHRNKDAVNARKRAARRNMTDEAREKRNAASRKYYSKNREKCRAKKKAYDDKNRLAIQARDRDYYHQNKDRINEQRKQNRIGLRDHLRHTYGLTIEERDAMFAAQGHTCAVCNVDEVASSKDWHVDHCHDSGKVRGILCRHCNLTLGYVQDNPAILLALVLYLEQHR